MTFHSSIAALTLQPAIATASVNYAEVSADGYFTLRVAILNGEGTDKVALR